MMKKKLFLIIIGLLGLNFLYSQNLDIKILRKINLNRNTNLDNSFRGLTNTVTPIAVGIPILLFGKGLLCKDSLTIQKSIYIGFTVFSAAVVSTALKYSINRTRPFVTYPDIEKMTTAGSPSFPSGHTSDAFALATSFSIVYPKWYIVVPSYLWAGTVAYSRMDLGVHYPSDVLAGAIIGSGSAYLCYKGQQWLNKKRNK